MSDAPDPQENVNPSPRTLSGKAVILTMFGFATVITATLWFYWRLHVGPFLPLQQKLAAEFPDSRPRVEGGQRKMHKGTPKILRITMKVEFNPTTDRKAAESFADRVYSFVQQEFSLEEYEVLELHFYWPDPEKTIKAVTIERKIGEPRPS